MNDKVYIHEFVDVIGHNRARYMHHMTANWCPQGRAERNQLCFGVWGTVGSTGRWPEVVNLWELDGWDGLVANFEHEFTHASLQDPTLAEWWAVAASLRRGGVDRILVPEPWTSSIEPLTAAGINGELYAHELVTFRPGGARAWLDELAAHGRATVEAEGAQLIGAWRVAMTNDAEAIALWALPSWSAWAAIEQSYDTGPAAAWKRATIALGGDLRRILLVDSPLSPLRIGRQPEASDRLPLDSL